MEQDKKKYTAQDKWAKANTEYIHIKANNKLRLSERIAQAVELGKAPSKNAFMIDAILAALEKDSI